MTPGLGVVADDLTGACDVAAGLSALGLHAQISLGIPDAADRPDADVAVVALKARTAPAASAVADSIAAARMLRGWGATLIYQKYCSTFDSTDAGNIGPVADGLLDEMTADAISVGTPATPSVGRTLHHGHLFVGDRLLSESSLAQHPLTPMHDPDLVRVLARQTPHAVGLVPIEEVRRGASAVAAAIRRLRARGVRHLLVDAVLDDDLDAVAAALAETPDVLAGGAAGLITAIARSLAPGRPQPPPPAPEGKPLILSGSGSERTRAQVAAHGGPRFDLDPDAVAADAQAAVDDALAFLRDTGEGVPLITATAEPDEVARTQQRWGRERSAQLIENALGRIASAAVAEHGVRRILVAGGETSGAVAAALGVRTLRVRRVVAPGVAWTTAADRAGRMLDLCLKSGNFGGVDLLAAAWEEAP
ncbi:3-oxo-tetronate kinase [Microbacterium sp. NPDC058345]|uniref:3-oxo-tetronate kinase n=1 Tax=Microbacterium sp. NPDC058345 TaxID=3346455 RepID=UPI00365A699B